MAGPTPSDPYAVLGVSPGADDVVVRAAWKALLRKYHPDTCSEPGAAERTAQINAAFTLLAKPEARAAYDRSRRAQANSYRAPQRPPPPKSNARPAPKPAPKPVQRPAPRPAAPRVRLGRRGKLLIGASLAGSLVLAAIAVAHHRGQLPFPAPLQRRIDRVKAADLSLDHIRATVRDALGLDSFPDGPSATPVATKFAEPPEINDASMIDSVDRFDRVYAQKGIAGAIAASRACAADAGPRDWAAQDACAALDFAGEAATSGSPDAQYFQVATVALPARYAELSEDQGQIAARLDRIRTTVWPAILDRMEVRLADQRRYRR
ncbi:hypothetical protein BH09PSE4_BH09PSE4_13590 [soil metagenome]